MIKKKYLIILLLFVFCSLSKAQDVTAVKLRLISPGIYFEHGLTDRTSIMGGAGVGLRYISNYNSASYTIYYIPVIKAEARAYFSSEVFSGPYLSGEVKYRVKTPETVSFLSYGPMIGYQNRFNIGFFNISFGAGMRQQNGLQYPIILSNLELGFMFCN